MKRIPFILLFILFNIVSISCAQNSTETYEQKATKLTAKMTKIYGLNTTQSNALYPVNLKYIQDLETGMKNKNANSNFTLFKTNLDNKYYESVLAILNQQQKVKFQADLEKRKQQEAAQAADGK